MLKSASRSLSNKESPRHIIGATQVSFLGKLRTNWKCRTEQNKLSLIFEIFLKIIVEQIWESVCELDFIFKWDASLETVLKSDEKF